MNKFFDRFKQPGPLPSEQALKLNEFKNLHQEFFDPAPQTGTPPTVNLPVLPLRNLVIFPEMIVPVIVGRLDSVRAVEKSSDDTKKIIVIAQKDQDKTFVSPEEDLYRVGVIAEIAQTMRMPDGSLRLILVGGKRIRILSFRDVEGVLHADAVHLDNEPVTDLIELEACTRYAVAQLQRYIKLLSHIPDDLASVVDNIDDILHYANILSSYLPGPLASKQELLETTDVCGQLKKIGALLEKECQINDVGQQIREKASYRLKQAEKEYFLREQLKAIQEELKENGDESAEPDIAKKMKELKLPPEAVKQVENELKHLEKIPSMSPEYGLTKSYIDYILDLPWSKKDEENSDLNHVSSILEADHFGLDKVKERILEFLAIKKLAPGSKGPILCFVGPPGTGKTSLAKSVAGALGRKYIRISLGGVRDEAEIRGHRRTYIGALPGRIISGMKNAGVINPLILLDEVDKMDSDFRGDPTSALLEVLDPEQNHAFVDHFLEVPYDLSQVLFITTANLLYHIPEPLSDRLEIIQLSSYTEEEKIEIAVRHLIPKQILEHGLTAKNQPVFSLPMITAIITRYTKEPGVRELERNIAKICRKIGKKIVDGSLPEKAEYSITRTDLEAYLGPEKYKPEEKEPAPQIGIATGLAWTEVGGVIMPIEVATMPGKGNLIITGQLGDIMQESAKAALSYIRSRETQFKLAKGFNEKLDIHIHVPEGAVPKDGPSAGIAIASALVSALTKTPVASQVAMTGEITLRGRVLPIGGLKEKILAAHRARIPTVIIPKQNTSDLPDIPEKIRNRLTIIPVDTMDEVLSNVLVAKPSTSTARTKRKAKSS